MRKIELKGDQDEQPRFTIVGEHQTDETTDMTSAPEEAPAQDR